MDNSPTHRPHYASNISGWVLAIRDTLRSNKLDAEALFSSAEISEQSIQRANSRISIEKINRLWNKIDELTGDDGFAMQLPRFITHHALHGYSFAVSSSENVEDFLTRMARFSNVASTAARLKLIIDKQCAQLIIDTSGANPGPAAANIDAFAAVIVSALRSLVDKSQAQPYKIKLERRKPNNLQAFEKLFRCPIEFDADENAILYKTEVLALQNPYRNADVVAHNERAITEYLEQLQVSTISQQVYQALAQCITNGPPTQVQLSARLGLSARSLQRHLKEEGTSFQAILDNLRFKLSKKYLRDQRQTITEVAYLLGYNDSSHFARSFKRWSGMSPKQYRQDSNS